MKITLNICCGILAITGGEFAVLIVSVLIGDYKQIISSFIAFIFNILILKYVFLEEVILLVKTVKRKLRRR